MSPLVTWLPPSSANALVAVPTKLAPMAAAPPASAPVFSSDLRFTERLMKLFSFSISSLSFCCFEICDARDDHTCISCGECHGGVTCLSNLCNVFWNLSARAGLVFERKTVGVGDVAAEEFFRDGCRGKESGLAC